MSIARVLLAVTAGAACGYAIAGLLWLTITDVGVGVAIAAACVVAGEAIRVVQCEQMRQERERVWRRRIEEPDWLFADLKPWPIGDDEVRR